MWHPSLVLLVALAAACAPPKANDCTGDGVELVDGECVPVTGDDTGTTEEDDDGVSGDDSGGDAGGGGDEGGDSGTGGSGGDSGSDDGGTGGTGGDEGGTGGDDGGPVSDTELDVEGYYSDLGDYSYDLRTDTITVTLTGPGSVPLLYHLSFIDNSQAFAIAQNDAGNWTGGGDWSRFDWHEAGGADLYLCHSTTSAASESDALSSPPATSSDLSNGCKGVSWIALTQLSD
jgi:hypothetical protein